MVSKGVTKTGESHCMSCGAIVDRDSDRCQSCYSDLDSEVKAFNCPRCKTVMELGTPQCTKCGMRFIVKSVKPRDPVEDDRLLAKLMDWGKKPSSEMDADAETEEPSSEPSPEMPAEGVSALSEDEAASIAKLGEELEGFLSEREATLSRMRNRIDMVRENISAFTASRSDSRVDPDDFEGTLSALSKDFTDIASLQMRLKGLSKEVQEIISSPGISASLEGRDLSVLIGPMMSGASSGDDINSREEQIVKREEMVDRKIKAYAQKMKQLEAREAEIEERLERGVQAADGPSDDRATKALQTLMGAASEILAIFEIDASQTEVDDVVISLKEASDRMKSVMTSRVELEQQVAKVSEEEEEMRRLLKVLDNLLGQLPSDVIDRFSKSEDFALYERILDRMKI